MLDFSSIWVELTPRCNQRCVYCYNAWRGEPEAAVGELTADQVCTLIDKVRTDAKLSVVTLSGGEPFLRPDILNIIDRVNARGLSVSIISNGSLVSEEMARGLTTRDIHYVQVTLAGPDAGTHDAHCGSGSFEGTTRAARRLTDAGVDVGGSFLCTSRSFDRTGATLERMRTVGIRHHYAFNRINPSGHAAERVADLMPTRSQVLVALGQAEAFAVAHDTELHCTMPIPHCMVDEAQFPHISFGQCSAGSGSAEYAIDARGNLKLCPLQQHPIGSLWKHSFADLVKDEAVSRFRQGVPEFCRECPHAEGCLGGCGAAAEWAFGSASEVDPFLAQHVMADFPDRAGLKDEAKKG